ncbi:MAG: hypothetical protein M1587_04030, partial [Thaumarchaeota archaeon]|nr:hypothetical protein [Nitrososphaerota archaeon]
MKAVVIVALVIIGFIILVALNVVPGIHLPVKQQLISVSEVNLEPGGSMSNGYLINTFYDLNVAVDSLQNEAFLTIGPQNSSFTATVNGQTVTPSSQIYVTLKPLQPYAVVSLKQVQIQWTQGAAGYGSPLSLNSNGPTIQGTANSTQPQTNYFYVPSEQYWTFHYPIQVTVTKAGGTDPFTQTVVFDAVKQNQITVSNPANHDENITIDQIGFYQGALSQIPVGSPIFYNGGSRCALLVASETTPGNLCGFTNAQGAISSGYSQYWFGGVTQFGSSTGVSTQETQYYDGSCTHPGWGQIQGYASGLFMHNSIGYLYYPVTPSLTSPANPYNITKSLGSVVGVSYSANTNQCQGLDLTDWLYSSSNPAIQPYSNPYSNVIGWNVTQSQLSIDLPYSELAPALIPSMQILVSTSLANAVVSQVNNAQFKIENLQSYSSSVTSGGTTTVTMQIKDTSSFAGTATVSMSQSPDLFSLSPPSESLNLNAGQTGTVSFTTTALATSTQQKDSLIFYVSNDAGQVTDSQTLTLTDNPAPSLGTTSFSIVGVHAPSSIHVGTQSTVTLDIQSLGVAGTAYLSSASGDTQIAVVAPASYNQSMGTGNTVPVSFSLVGVALPQGVSAKNVTLYFAVSNGHTSQTKQVTVTVL